jgi:hypothetical protein
VRLVVDPRIASLRDALRQSLSMVLYEPLPLNIRIETFSSAHVTRYGFTDDVARVREARQDAHGRHLREVPGNPNLRRAEAAIEQVAAPEETDLILWKSVLAARST